MAIFIPAQNSGYTMDQVFYSVGGNINSLEATMQEQLNQLGNDPSPEALAQYQYMVIQWQTELGMLTNIMKSYGDAEKQIVQNIGS
jgi:type III secretion apparatus needle protein